MKAYGKRQQKRIARAEAMEEMAAVAEHFDLVLLMTLHDEVGFGATRLRRFFRRFVKKYDEYKRRYLASDESTECGDRTDTYILKAHLKEIGFDYDAECEEIRKELYGE